jgi:hypothetical protein
MKINNVASTPLLNPSTLNHQAPTSFILLTLMAAESPGMSLVGISLQRHSDFLSVGVLSLPATFRLPEHLSDVSILGHLIVCATPRLATAPMFTEYLQLVTNQQLNTHDVIEVATSLHRFLRSDCQLVSCLEHASWVHLCQCIRKVTLSLANQASVVSSSPSQVAVGALFALLRVTPQADNILDSASDAGSVMYRLEFRGHCAVEVITQPLLMEPAWLTVLVANPGVAGLLSGPPPLQMLSSTTFQQRLLCKQTRHVTSLAIPTPWP